MDWFSWLSKTHLQPPFIHEYAVAFSHNQLEEDDIAYFNHEFLQSMGISIAKHRLEILKLAKGSSRSHPIAKLLTAIKKTKRTLASYIQTWVHRNDSAMVRVKRRSYSSRWKGAMAKRSNKLVMKKQGSAALLITNGYPYPPPAVKSGGARVNSFSSPVVDDGGGEKWENCFTDDEDGGDCGGYWSGRSGEKIKWDAMFQNLKPT
ncbi:hypothetical protein LXL04_031004 [Taraxacum kok-saghyz]